MGAYKNIKQWVIDERPREKLLKHGRSTLSTSELLAILIGSGSKNESAVDLSKRILSFYNNSISQLSRASAEELCSNFKGIGTAKALTIIAAMELASRKGLETEERMKISSSDDAFKLFLPRLSDLTCEEFWVALLNNANRVINVRRLSSGGRIGTVVDKAMLMKIAIEYLASAMIICHNHPSGTLEASQDDIRITKEIKYSCNIFDIRLLDHIIIGGNNYFSFADNKLL